MRLDEHYLGDEAFAKYSAAFTDDWDAFPGKDELLNVVGSIDLARPIAFHCGSRFSEWLRAKIPALGNLTPLECLSSQTGIRRLKSCLMRMP
jgi:hypothetical protein